MKKETFGEYIRKLRETKRVPLRKLAAALDIDQSTLSKIERNERQPTNDMVPALAEFFNLDQKKLKVMFLGDKITYQLSGENLALEALKVAEERIKYEVKEN